MNRKILGITAALGLFAASYGMLATLFIRCFSKRIIKKAPSKGIALTFDDGPNEMYTVRLLDLLKKHNIKATFFVVGEKVKKYPAIVKRMYEEGHDIGIHHYEHLSSWRMTPKQLAEQLKKTDEVIYSTTGERPKLYRPTWGKMNMSTLHEAKHLDIVLWSHLFGDWKIKNCETKLLDALREVPADGSILLLHDDGQNPGADDAAPAHMLDKLEQFIEESIAEGIAFIKIDGRKDM